MIVNKLNLIDSHLSSKKVSSSQLYASPAASSISVAQQLAQTNQVVANKSKIDNTCVPPGMKEEKIFVTDTMGNKLWDFENNQYQTKTIYVPVTPYDVAGVHLQSTTDTGTPTVTETVSAKPTTAVKAEVSGRGESDRIALSMPRPKRFAFVKEAPLASQND